MSQSGKSKYSIFLFSDNAVLFYIALFKFIILLIFANNYGLFRDEFYYLACARHLDLGYVDQPALSIFILAISKTLFGQSIIGVRILAYIASCVTVFMAGLIARELNGGKFAQALAAVSVLFAGVLLGSGSYFSMNVFDILFSTITFYLLIKLLKNDNPKLWIYIGILFGIGLENKYSFLFLGFGFAIALLLTNRRKDLLSKYLWIGAGLAVLLFLPHIIWQIKNHYPTLDFIHNAALYKNRPMSFGEFFKSSIDEMNPVNIILLAAALYYLFINKDGRKFIFAGIAYVAVFLVFVFNNGKPYYMGILYPMILAAGAVGIDYIITRYLRKWVRYILLIVLLPVYLVAVPFAIPVLSVDSFINLTRSLGKVPKNAERSELGLLPQFFSDRFGWEDMVQKTALAYNKLSPEEKKHTIIFGQNYGEAGAVEYYSEIYGLQSVPVVSSHNSYWMWGYPDMAKDTNTVWIVIGSNYKDNSKFFESVEFAASHKSKYGMPFENVDIFICKKPKMPVDKIWDRIKLFI